MNAYFANGTPQEKPIVTQFTKLLDVSKLISDTAGPMAGVKLSATIHASYTRAIAGDASATTFAEAERMVPDTLRDAYAQTMKDLATAQRESVEHAARISKLTKGLANLGEALKQWA